MMQINGLFAEVNLPDAPSGNLVYGLPPYCSINEYLVDYYNCPQNWMHGSGNAASYFIKVQTGKHLWIDLNKNLNHTHHMAVVISVQGVNPITFQKTDKLRLEQYKHNCPIHDKLFGPDRMCDECGYKWPPQNYMSTVSWPARRFWIDGFKSNSGTIQGFLITEETARGIASQLIGDDRVFAIGIAFYLSKSPKPVQPKPEYSSDNEPCIASNSIDFGGGSGSSLIRSTLAGAQSTRGGEFEPFESELYRKVEIGAGAQISQNLEYFDPSDLNYYQDTPAGMIYINYCMDAEFNKIIKTKKSQCANKGPLEGLKIGN